MEYCKQRNIHDRLNLVNFLNEKYSINLSLLNAIKSEVVTILSANISAVAAGALLQCNFEQSD